MPYPSRSPAPFTLLLGATLFASCSGSNTPAASTSTSITALSGPNQVAVVSADTGSGAGSGATGGNNVAPGAGGYAQDSDYITDKTSVYIYDPSMQALDTVNSILCQTSNTAYSEMVNKGSYKAQIDVSLCETGGSQESVGSDSGQSQGGASDLSFFTVRCARTSNATPQLVHFWVPGGGGGAPETIFAEMALSRGASLTDPFGAFVLNFAGVPDSGGSISNPTMRGVLKTLPAGNGLLGFSFYTEMGDINAVPGVGEFAGVEQVTVQMDTAMEEGIAHVRTQERYNFGGGDSGIQVTQWTLAFDAANLKRQLNSDTPVVLSRVNYDTMAWNYNLYHADGVKKGERVDLNSGFGFSTASGEYGWIGYYGMWLPEGVTVVTGDTITKDQFGSGEAATYTVLQAPGKLVRNERNTVNLTDLDGQTFRWTDGGSGTDFLVNYTGSVWQKTDTWDWSSNSWETIPGGPVTLDVNADAGGWLDMWSDSLGGRVNYVDTELFITFYAQTLITASDALFSGGTTATLYGFSDCLDFELTASEVEAGTIYLPNSTDVNAPLEYVFDQADLTLYYNNPGDTLRQVGLASGEIPTSGANTWGMTSGPMVENTSALTGTNDIWSVEVFYTYETGHNSWNRYTAITDSSSAPVTFDAPLQFSYTHTQAGDMNDDTTYAGQLYFFEYNGPGSLFGIPHDGTDIDGDGEPDRWYPRFSLLDGTLMGPTGSEYAVRAIEMEQTLQVDAGAGGSLDLTGAADLTLPDGSDYVIPGNGAQPTVTGPPAVIDGVVQGSN